VVIGDHIAFGRINDHAGTQRHKLLLLTAAVAITRPALAER